MKIETLKKDYDEADRDCGLINKREALLGNKKTDFHNLAVIQDELKPLYALWNVANRRYEDEDDQRITYG